MLEKKTDKLLKKVEKETKSSKAKDKKTTSKKESVENSISQEENIAFAQMAKEEQTAYIADKLPALLEIARKKKNLIERKEIIDFIGIDLDPDRLEEIQAYLEDNNIDIFPMPACAI